MALRVSGLSVEGVGVDGHFFGGFLEWRLISAGWPGSCNSGIVIWSFSRLFRLGTVACGCACARFGTQSFVALGSPHLEDFNPKVLEP